MFLYQLVVKFLVKLLLFAILHALKFLNARSNTLQHYTYHLQFRKV